MRGRVMGAVFTGPGGNSYEVPGDMLGIAGRGAELRAATELVQKMADALRAAGEHLQNVAFIKDVTLEACRDACRVAHHALTVTNLATDAAHKAVVAMEREITDVKIARDQLEIESVRQP